jgi:acyl-CoA reductase-like NAD-dependent aldehyde dehydrogenase
MTGADAPKSPRHTMASLQRWANVSPEERSAQMSAISKAGHAKRKAAREAARAAGKEITEPRLRTNSRALPSLDDVEVYAEAIREEHARAVAEADAAGKPRPAPLTYDVLLKESSLRLRRDIARQTYESIKRGAQ